MSLNLGYSISLVLLTGQNWDKLFDKVGPIVRLCIYINCEGITEFTAGVSLYTKDTLSLPPFYCGFVLTIGDTLVTVILFSIPFHFLKQEDIQ